MIRILNNSDLSVIETVTDYTSIVYNLKFTDSGTFILSLPPDTAAQKIKKNNYIKYKNNIGIVKYISKEPTGYTVQGCDIKGLLKQRIAIGTYTGKLETVIKNIVSDNITGVRSLPCLTVATDSARGENVSYTLSGESVSDALNKICTENNIGWSIAEKNGGLVFDIIIPTVTDIFYSPRYHNISDYNYTSDSSNNANTIVNFVTDKGLEMSTWKEYYNSSGAYNMRVTVKKGFYYTEDGKYYEFTEDYNSSATAPSKGKSQGYYLNGKSVTTSYNANYLYLGTIACDNLMNYTITNAERKSHIFYLNNENSGIDREETYLNESGVLESVLKNTDKLQKTVESATASIFTQEDFNTLWKLGDSIKMRLDVLGETHILTLPVPEIQISVNGTENRITPTFGEVKESVLKRIIKEL